MVLFEEHDSEIVGRIGLVGIQFHGLLKLGASLLQLVLPKVGQSQIVVAGVRLRLQLQGTLVVLD